MDAAERKRQQTRERVRRFRQRRDVTQSLSATLDDILGCPDYPEHRIFLELRSPFPGVPTREEAQTFSDIVVETGPHPLRVALERLQESGAEMPSFMEWLRLGVRYAA